MHKLLLSMSLCSFSLCAVVPPLPLEKKAPLLVITKKTQLSDREDVRQILTSFAEVMRYFFIMVQNPERGENIAVGLAGILAHIVQAGKVIMRGSDIMVENDKQLIQEWMATLKSPPKKMYTLIMKNSQ